MLEATQLVRGRTKLHIQSPPFLEVLARAGSWDAQMNAPRALLSTSAAGLDPHVPWGLSTRLLVQPGPSLAFGLLGYYTPIERVMKETVLSTWTLQTS